MGCFCLYTLFVTVDWIILIVHHVPVHDVVELFAPKSQPLVKPMHISDCDGYFARGYMRGLAPLYAAFNTVFVRGTRCMIL